MTAGQQDGALMLLDLRRGMERAGCPACWSRLIREERYLQSLLHEEVNEPRVRTALLGTMGFCPRHIWLLGRVEEAMYGDHVGTSILLASFLREWRRRIRELPPLARRGARAHAPRAGEGCRACALTTEGEAAELRVFVDRLNEDDERVRAAYEGCDGLCVDHLALMLEQVPDSPGRQWVLERALRDAEKIAAELDEYDRKRAWTNRDEPKGREQRAWRRASRLFGGVSSDLAAEARRERDTP